MTMTIHLPEDVEQTYAAAARDRGVSLDVLVTNVLVSHLSAVVAEPAQPSSSSGKWTEEDGIPVFRTGQPLDPSVVDDTLDAIRRERDISALRRN